MGTAQFHQDFPEFNDAAMFPDQTVQFWMLVATKMVNQDVWGDLYDDGVELCTAHHLAIGAQDQLAAEVGGIPGLVRGPQTTKSVDKVSVSFDTGSVTYEGAGFWNMTTYGIRYYQLARIVGAGGMQL